VKAADGLRNDCTVCGFKIHLRIVVGSFYQRFRQHRTQILIEGNRSSFIIAHRAFIIHKSTQLTQFRSKQFPDSVVYSPDNEDSQQQLHE
jgi:hypothetical protein